MDFMEFMRQSDEREKEVGRLIRQSQQMQAEQGTPGINAKILLLADLISHSILASDAATKENFEIQKSVKNMTWWVMVLTIAIFVLTLVCAYPAAKSIYEDFVQRSGQSEKGKK